MNAGSSRFYFFPRKKKEYFCRIPIKIILDNLTRSTKEPLSGYSFNIDKEVYERKVFNDYFYLTKGEYSYFWSKRNPTPRLICRLVEGDGKSCLLATCKLSFMGYFSFFFGVGIGLIATIGGFIFGLIFSISMYYSVMTKFRKEEKALFSFLENEILA